MRAMNAFTWALLLAVGTLTAPVTQMPALAKVDKTKMPVTTVMPALGDLRSFDVMDMERQDFSASRELIPHEAVEYARTALQNNGHLSYKSPAQGILRFKCENNSCSRIRAEVTEGMDGPVVWSTVQQYRRCPFVDFSFMPDSKKFANTIVSLLAQDYQSVVKVQTAIKAVPAKIQIEEE